MTRTAKTRFNIINDMLMKAILAEGSTNGKNSGMMILVTQLAIIVYIVSDVMLPPSFSVMTAAAAAVGQITHRKQPSHSSRASGFVVCTIISTSSPESEMRMPWRIKCHVRGWSSLTSILQNVT